MNNTGSSNEGHILKSLNSIMPGGVIALVLSVSSCVGQKMEEQSELLGLYCNVKIVHEGSKNEKAYCICFEINDEVRITSVSFKNGERRREKIHEYELDGDQLIIDVAGDAGLESLVMTNISNRKIVSAFDINRGTLAVEYKRRRNAPSECD